MTEPRLITTEPVAITYITMHGAYARTPEGYSRLYAWVGQHGLQPSGMPAAVYLTMPQETPEAGAVWELWAPIAGDPAEAAPEEYLTEVRMPVTKA